MISEFQPFCLAAPETLSTTDLLGIKNRAEVSSVTFSLTRFTKRL
jgi:hypothetical protein